MESKSVGELLIEAENEKNCKNFKDDGKEECLLGDCPKRHYVKDGITFSVIVARNGKKLELRRVIRVETVKKGNENTIKGFEKERPKEMIKRLKSQTERDFRDKVILRFKCILDKKLGLFRNIDKFLRDNDIDVVYEPWCVYCDGYCDNIREHQDTIDLVRMEEKDLKLI